jgi:hypothetical protein
MDSTHSATRNVSGPISSLAILLSIATISSGRTCLADPDHGAGAFASALRCGPNCLYMIMRLHGSAAEYVEVVNAIRPSTAPDAQGASLADLVKAANDSAFPCQVKRYGTARELAGCGLPLIAHFAAGHYVVVLAVDDEYVRYMDGSSGATGRLRLGKFQSLWSGYVVEPRLDGANLCGVGSVVAALGIAAAVYSVLSSG